MKTIAIRATAACLLLLSSPSTAGPILQDFRVNPDSNGIITFEKDYYTNSKFATVLFFGASPSSISTSTYYTTALYLYYPDNGSFEIPSIPVSTTSTPIDGGFRIMAFPNYRRKEPCEIGRECVLSRYMEPRHSVYARFASSSSVGVRIQLGVPEPASWALLILGFGVVGWAMRRRGLQPLLNGELARRSI